MFKAMNFRESGEDKSDVLIANSIILGAFDQIDNGYEAGVYRGFCTGCAQAVLKKNFNEVAGVDSHKFGTLLRGTKIIYNPANILQEFLAQRYNFDDKL